MADSKMPDVPVELVEDSESEEATEDPEIDAGFLRHCTRCKQTAYLRKGGCANPACEAWLNFFVFILFSGISGFSSLKLQLFRRFYLLYFGFIFSQVILQSLSGAVLWRQKAWGVELFPEGQGSEEEGVEGAPGPRVPGDGGSPQGNEEGPGGRE